MTAARPVPSPAANAPRLRRVHAEAVSSTTLAYNAIKSEILNNRLRAGDAVPAERFARELRLSRTPIREAILQLAREGFIEIRPRMGTFVSRLDLRQIQDMYEVRSLLEGRAARLAATRVPNEKLKSVEDKLRSLPETGAIDCRAMSEAGQEVHNLIVRECGNQVLAQMIVSLRDHFQRFRSLSLEIPEKVLTSHREHLAIIEALRLHDGRLAEGAVHRHLAHAGKSLLENLLEGDQRSSIDTVTVLPRE